MWKAQLRSKTNTKQIDLDLKPVPKKKRPKCREEFRAMMGKIQSKIQEIKGSEYNNSEFTHDYSFNITGLNKYFQESIENIPDDFFCKVLDAIKQIDKSNQYTNPITFEYEDDTFSIFYGLSYEGHAGLSYYNYSSIYLILRTEKEVVLESITSQKTSRDNLVYMDLGFKGKDGFSFVPAPKFDRWKWW